MQQFLADKGVDTSAGPDLAAVCTLLKDRSQTLVEMADQAEYFYRALVPTTEIVEKHLGPEDEARLGLFAEGAATLAVWDQPTLSQYIKDFVKAQGVKMPLVACHCAPRYSVPPRPRRWMPCWRCWAVMKS